MKRFLIILLGTIFVLGLASNVFAAELKFGGDAFVEGVWRDGYDLDNTNSTDSGPNGSTKFFRGTSISSKETDDIRYWAQRVRLKFDAVVENGIEVRTRFRVSDAVWSGTANTKYGDTSYSTMDNWTAADDTAKTSNSGTKNYITPDYAYLHVPVGGATFDIGHQLASWGNGFWVWNAEVDRAKVMYNVNDSVMVGGFVQKDTELLQGDAEGDRDTWSVFTTVKVSDATKFGVIMVYTQDQPNDTANRYDEASEDPATATAANGTGKDYEKQDGFQLDTYFNTKAGNITILSEMAWKTGYMFSATDSNDGWNDQFGMFVAGVMDFSPVTVTAAFAYAYGKFKADNDFKPTYFFGTMDNPLAIADFQSLDEDRGTYAFVVGVDFKVNDALTIGGKMAEASFNVTGDNTDNTDRFPYYNGGTDSSQDGNSDTFAIWEFDLGMTYQIAKSTSYTIGMAYGIPTNVPEFLSFTDDQIFGMFNKLSISF